MKKCILMFLPFIFCAMLAKSQTISVSMKDQPITKVFREIEKQSDYKFVYVLDVVAAVPPVTVSVSKAAINEVLEKIFSNQPLQYEVSGKTIIIKKKPESEKPAGRSDKNIDLNGRIVNDKGEPVSGATVIVKGTERSTASGPDGNFQLRGIDARAVLVVSSIGFEPKTIRLSGNSSVMVQLSVSAMEMKEVVVMNTGYQQIPKERATGSFEQISNKKLNQQISTDILSRLEGVSSSILVDKRGASPSNNVLGGDNIVIRGLSTATESIKSPLIVLNNFPYEGDISNINPNDVESITILKDAAAASIWGARAGNGVIVITTKKGNYKQPTRFSVTSNIKITEKPDLFYLPSMSSSDYIDVEKMLFTNGFYDYEVDPNNGTRRAITPVVEILAQQKDGQITEAKANEMIDVLRGVDVRNDFSKYIYRKAVSQQYAMNLTGGTQNMRYALSAGYDKVLTALNGNDNDRITIRTDNTFMPVKNLEFDFSIGITSGKTYNNAIGEFGSSAYNYVNMYPSRFLYPYAAFADANGQPLPVVREYRLSYLQSLNVPGLANWEYRPLDEIRMADNTIKVQDLLLNAGVSYKLFNSLNAQVQYQYEKSHDFASNYYSRETFYTRDLFNLFSRVENDQLVHRVPKGGILNQYRSELTAQAIRFQLNFNKTFNGVHQLVALAGAESRERVLEVSGNTIYGFNKESYSSAQVNYDTLYSFFDGIGYGSGKIPAVTGTNILTDRFVSFFTNASWIYDNRISISGSVRRDASNLFGVDANNRWKPLWSVGTSWELSNEKFYRSDFFPFLKLRATYGFRGNVNNALTRYATITRFSAFESQYNIPFAQINTPADPSLQWESVAELNIGVDFRLKNSRFYGSIEAYRKLADKLIFPAILDPATGNTGVMKNSASIVTKGIQADLSSVNLNGKLKWTTNLAFNYTATKTKDYLQEDNMVAMDMARNGAGTGISLWRGKDPYGIYSIPSAGLDPATGDPQGYLQGKVSKDYFAILQQPVDSAGLIYHGSNLPRFYGFLNNTFTWKGISLTVNILYQFDFYFIKDPLNYTKLFNLGVTNPDFSKRWQHTGDDLHTNIPSMVYPMLDDYRDRFFELTSNNVLKGDNIRLQFVRLSYDISKPVFGIDFIQNLQLSFVANDLGFVWRANKDKLDPNFNSVSTRYPVPKSFALGLKLTF